MGELASHIVVEILGDNDSHIFDAAELRLRASVVRDKLHSRARPVAVNPGISDWGPFAAAFLGSLAAGQHFVVLPPNLSPQSKSAIKRALNVGPLIGLNDLDGTAGDSSGLRAGAGAALGKPLTLPDVDDSRPALTLFTSGTSGRPKSISFTYGDIGRTITKRRRGPEVVLVHGYPPWSYAGIAQMLLPNLERRVTLVSIAGHHPQVLLELCQRRRVHAVSLTPTAARMLVDFLDRNDERLSVPSIFIGGDVAPPGLLARLSNRLPTARISTVYTFTEAKGRAVAFPYVAGQPPAIIGQSSSSLRLLDDQGNDCLPGESGIIWLRTPDNGWTTAGDRGIMHMGDIISFCGRRSDLVSVGGASISLRELEETARRLPGVVDCVAFAIPHEFLGQQVCLLFEGTVEVTRLRQHFRTERVQAPHHVIVGTIPRNALGKPDHAACRRLVPFPTKQVHVSRTRSSTESGQRSGLP